MKRMWQTLRGFFKKEFRQTLRDPRMRMMLLVMPMVQMTLFGLALSSDVQNIRLAAHAEANDPLMQDIIRDALASGWFLSAERSPGIERYGFDDIRAGRAEVALFAPPGGLTQAFTRREGRLQLMIDSADLVRARQIENYVRAIVARATREHTGIAVPPQISFDIRVLYNPEMVSAYYLVPGVMSMLMCIITIMLTSMSLAKEKEVGTFETLIAAPVSTSEILLGKTIPFILIGAANFPLIMGVGMLGFGVPMRGSFLSLALAAVFFLISTVSVGTLISTIARNQQQAMMGSFIFLLPAILLSGIMFPIDNMPEVLRIVARADPIMYFITLLRNIMLKGGDPVVLWKSTGALALIAAVSSAFAFKRFRMHLG
jgi:ABC-2 type transport system permease protein